MASLWDLTYCLFIHLGVAVGIPSKKDRDNRMRVLFFSVGMAAGMNFPSRADVPTPYRETGLASKGASMLLSTLRYIYNDEWAGPPVSMVMVKPLNQLALEIMIH